MNTLKIDLVSDVVCPWCIIGYKHLEQAMAEVGGEMTFELEWHPFELNPHMAPEGENATEHLMAKYGRDRDSILAAREEIRQRGEDLGFTFQFSDEKRVYNTFDAHRALHWAREQGKQTELKLALFDAYFTQGKNPSDPAVLIDAAKAVGLDGDKLGEVLLTNQYEQDVRAELQHFQQMGIQGVPSFIVNQKYMITGAQAPDTLVRAFRHIVKEAA